MPTRCPRLATAHSEPGDEKDQLIADMSYLEHFKLNEQPFQLTPDPDFVYWSKQHARAKSYMESTVWLSDGFVIVTGDIGSGKTTMLQSFLSDLDDSVNYAMITQTQLAPTQFLQAVLAEFGFKPFNKRKVELLDMLNTFLIEQYAAGKRVLLIVDEAQNLSRNVLEEIRLLSGIETRKEKVLRIILAGQPELRDTVESDSLKQLMQRVRLRLHLGPLDRSETQEYIEHRLKVAGSKPGKIFDPECFPLIYRYAGGVPRLTNTLCDTAMLCAFAENKTTVNVGDVEAAVDELGWTESKENTGQLAHLKAIGATDTGTLALGRLDVKLEGKTVSSHLLTPGRMIIGRTADNEIYVNSKFISRHHAQIVTSLDRCFIEDLNSTNGIYVGEKRVKKYTLSDGDSVSIGMHQFAYTDLRHVELEDEDSVVLDQDDL